MAGFPLDLQQGGLAQGNPPFTCDKEAGYAFGQPPSRHAQRSGWGEPPSNFFSGESRRLRIKVENGRRSEICRQFRYRIFIWKHSTTCLPSVSATPAS